jgi:hypothetical protein
MVFTVSTIFNGGYCMHLQCLKGLCENVTACPLSAPLTLLVFLFATARRVVDFGKAVAKIRPQFEFVYLSGPAIN